MSRSVIQWGWDDVPHLTEDMIQKMVEGMLPHQAEARRNGTPTLGSGAIYPVPEEDIKFSAQEIAIDAAWPRAFGLDVGWKKNAGIWGAYDSGNDIIYLYSEYYRGHAEPAVHASACKTRGDWIPCIIDSAANSSSQVDGRKLLELYVAEGLNCIFADKAVDAGLLEVYQRLSTGRLKVEKNLADWLFEYRIYSRDEKGKIKKENDHLMDATRYLVMGLANFQQIPINLYKRGRSTGHNTNYDPFGD